jgi:hypothetical protein
MMSRRWAARAVVLVVVLALATPAALGAVSPDADETALKRGTIEDPANGTTVVSNQGFNFRGKNSQKKPARLVGVGERGQTRWVHDSAAGRKAWFYDVDPLPNGNLLVVSPRQGITVVYELDPDSGERVWNETLPFEDTHDIDRLDEHRLLVANMRQWNESAGRSDDRLLVYNRTTDEVTWEWYFRNHYPADTDGGMNDDWTHVNDVDVIDEHRVLASPRNFDQVVVVNRTTGDIEMRLGSDDQHEVLFEQHNPDYLVGENGTPTILVADSENNRVVEYARVDGEWTRTWSVGSGQLNWPRDADRLPNGNTLITDTLNHRVIEVTPEGRIVWEYYSTWGPYDAERVVHGDSSTGPTIRQMNATGTYSLSGSAGLSPGSGALGFSQSVRATVAGTPVEGPAVALAEKWAHTAPWVRPVWLTTWQFFFLVVAALVAALWLVTELAVAGGRVAVDRFDAAEFRK